MNPGRSGHVAEPFPKAKQLARGERRYRRKIASPKQWQAIRAEKLDGQPCRVCFVTEYRPDFGAKELHHLVSRSALGDDVAENLVPLCGSCHQRVTMRQAGALRWLAESLTDAEYAYCVGKLGEGAMERLFGVSRGD
jgi:5-methylcytosine-specific restriction endonuclease McrA